MKTIALFHLILGVAFWVNPIFAQNINFEITVLDPNLKKVEDVIVYLVPMDEDNNLERNNTVLVITQINKKFAPYIAVTQLGSSLAFKNQDDFTHHIYSVAGKNRFEFKIKAGKEKNSPILNHIGEVAMGCNIHDWMSGYVLVVDTPYYAKTDENGKVIFDLASRGDYQLVVWHPQLELNDYKFEQMVSVGKKNVGKEVVGKKNVGKNIEKDKPETWLVKLPKALALIPEQENQDEFEFLEVY